MKRRQALFAVAAGAGTAAQSPAQTEWADPFARSWRDGFLLHWKVTADYTLAVIEAMPADGFSFKPTPIQRTFGEQMVHLGRANVAYMAAFGLIEPPKPTEETSKAAVREYVKATFDYVEAVLKKLSERDMARRDLKINARIKPHSGTDLFMRAYMHTAHHRGQVICYLRLKDIAPPVWAFEPSA
ncbi:MAG: DinB family protein [Bryobacteraceae bacterium]